jgi:hypothetical protein
MTTLNALIDKPSPFAELKDEADEFIKRLDGNNGV